MATTRTSTRSRGPGRAVLWALLALGLLAALVLLVDLDSGLSPGLYSGQRTGQRAASPRQLVDEDEVRALARITVQLRGAPPFTVTRPGPGTEQGPTLTPPGVGADAAAVGALLAALQAKVLRRLPLSAGTEARYGLASPRLELGWPSGPGLQLGDATADGAVYARRTSAPEILVVDATAVEPLLAPADRYRSRALFRTPLRDAGHIELPTLALSHKREGWSVSEPAGRPAQSSSHRADEGAVRALLERLDGLLASRLVEPRLALPETPPPLVVRVDGIVRLQGGWPCPGDAAARWLHRDDGEDLCASDADGLALLSPPETSLLPARLGRFPAGAITRVVRERVVGCESAAAPQEELQREAGWRLAQPAGLPLDRAAADRLVAALASLQVERWPPPAERSWASLRPQLRLTIETRDGTQQLGLELSGREGSPCGAPDEPLSDAGCFVRSDGELRIAALTAETCAALAAPLLSRSLLGLDEARLLAAKRIGADRAEAALPVDSPVVRAALRGLTTAARVQYGLPQAAPRATVRIEHGPPPTELVSDEVAPQVQEIRVYGSASAGAEPLRAVRVGRALTYTLSPEASRTVAALLAARP
jgi:hypothetical protein